MLENILNLRVLIILVIIACNLPVSASNKIEKEIDTLNVQQSGEVIENLGKAIESLEYRVMYLEKRDSGIDKDRALWQASLNTKDVLFTVFIALILFSFGFISYGLFIKYMSNFKKKQDELSEEMDFKNLSNESLMFRNMFFTSYTLEHFDSAILWASRVLCNETELKKYIPINIDIIQDFIKNLNNVIMAEPLCLEKTHYKEKTEILTNCKETMSKLNLELDEVHKKLLDTICKFVIKETK